MKGNKMYEIGTITNNEGEKIVVDFNTLSELANLYFNGHYAAIIKDKVGEIHSIILPDNKKELGIN